MNTTILLDFCHIFITFAMKFWGNLTILVVKSIHQE